MSSITIVGPCYNEDQNIDEYIKRVVKIVEKLNLDYKIILVDDGSEDNTWTKISEHTIDNNRIHGLKFTRNFGHQAALMAGINFANSDYIFCSDVDLQDPPELLEQMFKKIKEKKLDVVFGKRTKNDESFLKKYSSIAFYKFFNLLSNTKINEQTSDFILMNNKVISELKKVKDKDIFLRGLIPWFGFNSDFVEFQRQKRQKGISGWSISKMIDFSLTALLSFSNFPMRLSFLLSFVSIILFLILTFFAIYSYFSHDVVKGWTSLFLIISFFNTIIFFVLGIMAEYVGRIYLNSKNKPLYILDKTSKNNEV
ncbi:glycosyltransferase family 2 protein [Candidatus Pelagibacter sp.]|nr:glycosyltransferase family 2 protein [Candidatus Pelagibacter sp.]